VPSGRNGPRAGGAVCVAIGIKSRKRAPKFAAWLEWPIPRALPVRHTMI
jgi:hypothetical protein